MLFGTMTFKIHLLCVHATVIHKTKAFICLSLSWMAQKKIVLIPNILEYTNKNISCVLVIFFSPGKNEHDNDVTFHFYILDPYPRTFLCGYGCKFNILKTKKQNLITGYFVIWYQCLYHSWYKGNCFTCET